MFLFLSRSMWEEGEDISVTFTVSLFVHSLNICGGYWLLVVEKLLLPPKTYAALVCSVHIILVGYLHGLKCKESGKLFGGKLWTLQGTFLFPTAKH